MGVFSRFGRFTVPGALGASIRALVVVALVVIASAAGVAQSATEVPSTDAGPLPPHRVALVIGNATYAVRPLKNPRHDAAAMSRTLAATGFDVMTVMDGSRLAMEQAIDEFARRIDQPNTVALFYYAGHGIQTRGDNYLIPVEARIETASEIESAGVALDRVFKALRRDGGVTNIIILDACRDNPFADKTGQRSDIGLAPVVAPAGTIIGYATAPGQIASDGAGDSSPYTHGLATAISVPGLTIEDVFRAARRSVIAATAGQQTSWEHSSLVSGFVFVAKLDTGMTAGDALAASGSALGLDEIAAWQAIRTSNDPAAFRAHVARYPNGLFAELAASRISVLDAARAMAPWSRITTSLFDAVKEAADADVMYRTARTLVAELDEPAARLVVMPDIPLETLRRAATLYAEAAAKGHVAAMFELARAYDKGRGVGRDLVQAAGWYKLAADQGHHAAMASLGTMYEYGEGVGIDFVEAVRLYQLAADAGDAAGAANLAYLFNEGKGVARDVAMAERLYRQAAEGGHARAMHNLALLELSDPSRRPDPSTEAVRLFEQAAALNYGPSLRELARVYDSGRGVPRDANRAADYILAYLRFVAVSEPTASNDELVASFRFTTRRAVQKRLAARGLYDGMAHGIINAETRRALFAASGK